MSCVESSVCYNLKTSPRFQGKKLNEEEAKEISERDFLPKSRIRGCSESGVDERHPAHGTSFASDEPAPKALVMERVATYRAQPGELTAFKLHQTYPTSVDRCVHQDKLQFDAPVFRSPTPFDFDVGK